MTPVTRWSRAAKASESLEKGRLKKSWEHFIPETMGFVTGVCLGIPGKAFWDHGSTVCLVLDEDRLPEPRWRFEAQIIFNLTHKVRNAVDMRQVREVMKLGADARANPVHLEQPDEVFVGANIRLKDILLGVGLRAGADSPKELQGVIDLIASLYPAALVMHATKDQFGFEKVLVQAVRDRPHPVPTPRKKAPKVPAP